MRRILLAGICTLLVAISTLGTTAAAVAQDGVLAGTWTSIDSDGSNQELVISGSGHGAYAMFLFDDSATGACGGAPAIVVGSGAADGNTLLMRGTLACLPGGNVLRGRLTVGFEYSPSTDTLTDETGVTWHRS